MTTLEFVRMNTTPGRTLRASPTMEDRATTHNPERWVEEHGDFLYSIAMVRLRDPARAQDAVQETFLAALRSRHTFAGKSTERGWLTGILKHKILDHYRKAARETLFADLEFYEGEEGEMFEAGGVHQGSWTGEFAPTEWDIHPGRGLDRAEFWQVFRACAAKLPQRISRVFLMRELDGIESKEICSLLGVSQSNLWVMLHRARLALRRCLEENWFSR